MFGNFKKSWLRRKRLLVKEKLALKKFFLLFSLENIFRNLKNKTAND
jgi:hypothetical protein